MEKYLLRVSTDISIHGDGGKCYVLILLDLSVAFDTVEHCILVEMLKQWVASLAQA